MCFFSAAFVTDDDENWSPVRWTHRVRRAIDSVAVEEEAVSRHLVHPDAVVVGEAEAVAAAAAAEAAAGEVGAVDLSVVMEWCMNLKAIAIAGRMN